MPTNVSPTPTDLLAGVTVLVTRPRHQAGRLCQLIEARGGHAILFPVLEITEIEDSNPARKLIARLEEFDFAIFVSANAVQMGAPMLDGRVDFPAWLQVAVIGKRTAEALQTQGLRVDIVPQEGFTSEALLAMPEMHEMQGKSVLIFRGTGGREALGDTLAQRGALVSYAEVYRRVRPAGEGVALTKILEENNKLVIIVTSNEGLQNLFDMAGMRGQPLLQRAVLVVMSKRNAELAQSLGFSEPPVIVERAGDEGLLDAVLVAARSMRRGES
ncbi:MAG: uroporphyrinogen-III synthase [Gammaproteobacteria bacterium]|nr:uroporphyrinogen-III synthase [Gammaproteobacteria bacterium]